MTLLLKSSRRRDAVATTRDACATQSDNQRPLTHERLPLRTPPTPATTRLHHPRGCRARARHWCEHRPLLRDQHPVPPSTFLSAAGTARPCLGFVPGTRP